MIPPIISIHSEKWKKQTGLLSVARNIALAFGFTYLTSSDRKWTSVIYATLGGQYFFASLFKETLNFSDFKPILPDFLLSKHDIQIKAAIRYYHEHIDLYPPKYKKHLADKFAGYDDGLFTAKYGVSDILQSIYYPFDSKEIDFTPELETEIRTLCSPFDPETQKILFEFVNWIIFASKNTRAIPLRKILYFQGPPGVGKTHFTKELARILGLYLFEMNKNCKKKKDPRLVDFLNQYVSEEPGELHRNDIFFIDEFDKICTNLSQWLSFTDPEANYAYNNNGEVHIAAKICIFAGNIDLDVIDPSGGLSSRIETIRFHPVTTEGKLEVGTLRLEQLKIYFDFLPSEEQMVELKNLITEDQDPGFREMLKLLNQEVSKMYFEAHSRFLRI